MATGAPIAKKASPGCAAIAITFDDLLTRDSVASAEGRPGIWLACKALVPMERAAALAPAIFKILRRVVLDMIHAPSYGLTAYGVIDMILFKKEAAAHCFGLAARRLKSCTSWCFCQLRARYRSRTRPSEQTNGLANILERESRRKLKLPRCINVARDLSEARHIGRSGIWVPEYVWIPILNRVRDVIGGNLQTKNSFSAKAKVFENRCIEIVSAVGAHIAKEPRTGSGDELACRLGKTSVVEPLRSRVWSAFTRIADLIYALAKEWITRSAGRADGNTGAQEDDGIKRPATKGLIFPAIQIHPPVMAKRQVIRSLPGKTIFDVLLAKRMFKIQVSPILSGPTQIAYK